MAPLRRLQPTQRRHRIGSARGQAGTGAARGGGWDDGGMTTDEGAQVQVDADPQFPLGEHCLQSFEQSQPALSHTDNDDTNVIHICS